MGWFRRRRAREAPIGLFGYHKVGTKLLEKIFREVSAGRRWSYASCPGRHDGFPAGADVVQFSHSLVDTARLARPFTGVHLRRDPRDVIVSGYLYHRRTREKWCVHSDLDPRSPITFPRVPRSQEHRPEEWKRAYLEALGGRSYQENLLALDPVAGLHFEMERYGAWTIEAMREWRPCPEILEVRFEDVMESFDETFRRIFTHLGLAGEELEEALAVAASHDIGRKSDAELARIEHVSGRRTRKWQRYFRDEHREAFRKRFGGVLEELGYGGGDGW